MPTLHRQGLRQHDLPQHLRQHTAAAPSKRWTFLASSDSITARYDHDDGSNRVMTTTSTASSTAAQLHRHGVTIMMTPTWQHGSINSGVCSIGFLWSWQNRWTHHSPHPLTSARCIVNDCSSVIYNIVHFFAPPALSGFIIHDDYTIDHDYITMMGYLDIGINGMVYINSSATTPVNSVCVVTSIHTTPAVTAGENRGEIRKAQEGDAITALGADAVDDGAAEKTTEAQDFKFSRNRSLHSRYD